MCLELLRHICPNHISSFDNLDIKKDEVISILQSNKRTITVKCLEFDKYPPPLCGG